IPSVSLLISAPQDHSGGRFWDDEEATPVTLQNYYRDQNVYHSDIIILKGQLTFEALGEEDQGRSGGGFGASAAAGGGGAGAIPFEIRHRKCVHQEELVVPYLNYRNRIVAVLKLSHGANEIRLCDKETGSVFDEFTLNYHPEEVSNQHYVKILNVISANNSRERNVEESEDEAFAISQKLKLGLSLVQTLFAEKLYENGFGRRSFRLKDQTPYFEDFEVSLSTEEILQLSTSDLWEYIAKEIRGRDKVWNKRCKYVAFVSHPWKIHYEHLHPHSHDDGSSTGKMALGGGGLAVIGTSFLPVWPDSVEKILDTIFSEKKLWNAELDNCAARFGAVDRTEGSLYAASVGSVLHEMGHIFDLGHTDAGLMGSQFNRIDTCLSPVLSYPPVCELFRSKLGSDVCPMRPKIGLPTNGCLSEDLLSIGISCATLLYFHKWFQPNSSNDSGDSEANIVLSKNKVVSKHSTLVTLQVRDTEDERLLKSWTFIEKTSREDSDTVALSPLKEFTLAKNHIPIPVCEGGDTNKALVVAEDCDGNLLKAVVSRDLLSESFTVIRRRT
ncbi:hypothetical protein Ocin01_00722, partial [Orchesella cincta]